MSLALCGYRQGRPNKNGQTRVGLPCRTATATALRSRSRVALSSAAAPEVYHTRKELGRVGDIII